MELPGRPGCIDPDGDGLVFPSTHGCDTVPGGQGWSVPGPPGNGGGAGMVFCGAWGGLPGIPGWLRLGVPGNVPGWVVPGRVGVPGGVPVPGLLVCAEAGPATSAPTRATTPAIFEVIALSPS